MYETWAHRIHKFSDGIQEKFGGLFVASYPIPFHQDDIKIAATIIAMGHILGLKVLANGVETQELLAFLQEKGCDIYQGYIKSKPVSAHEFAEFLCNQQRVE